MSLESLVRRHSLKICVLCVVLCVCVCYLLCEALQALVGAADHHVLPDSHQTDGMRRQLDAVLGFVRLPEEQQHTLVSSESSNSNSHSCLNCASHVRDQKRVRKLSGAEREQVSVRCVSPAQDVDVAIATRHRDAKLHVKLTRHIHHGGSGGQRHLHTHTHTSHGTPRLSWRWFCLSCDLIFHRLFQLLIVCHQILIGLRNNL